jgi:hypothetical protein
MITNRSIILLLTIAAMITINSLPCRAARKDANSIWTEEELKGPGVPERGQRSGGPEIGRGPGGPERGRGPGGPERFELTNEEINRILNSLKQSDPNAVKELEKLRKEDPEKFQAELRKYGREEFGKIIRERIDGWRRQRQTDFIQWLGKNYPKESENLAKLRETEPNVYMEKYEHIRNKYWQIFDEERRNPELAEILKEDLVLKDKRDELVIRFKAANNEKDKQKLMAELEEVVGRRFDLIVRRKEMEYERLLKWLEELRNRARESRDEIDKKWKNEQFKIENVKKYIKDLTEPSLQFRFD